MFIGAGVLFILIGVIVDGPTIKEENFKNFFMYAGISILGLYFGLSWKKPTYGGGVVHKYAAIGVGVLCGFYSVYAFIKIFS